MKFVIFHGSFGNPEGNWFQELKEKLEALGQQVLVPQFPVENWEEVTKIGPKGHLTKQNLKNWFRTYEKEVLPFIRNEKKICFIGHSLGPLFILHIVDKYNLLLDSAFFVVPFISRLNNYKGFWQFDKVNATFYKTDFDFAKLRKLIPISYVLYSTNDPYVPSSYPKEFSSRLNSSTILVNKAGHLNSEVNLNEFPLIFELCKTRLNYPKVARFV
jgi:predicted alpha/beta hydrolase family esterase